ncbi:MAG: plasmid mobilization relaxosome protein MobC [Lachnospiraceae bacterium]|nr:plasmid mobilization relaxosome protein MobC [Lachnospiraceae bacterium]
MARHDSMIYIRVSKDEWKKIRERMDEAGMNNMSAFIRRMALYGYLIRLDLSDVREVLRLLRIESNNLNQYAKRANETGSIYEADIKELQGTHKEILSMMGEILDRLSSI